MQKDTMRHIPEIKVLLPKFEDVPSVRLEIGLHFWEAYTSMFVSQIVASLFIDFIEVAIPDKGRSFFQKN